MSRGVALLAIFSLLISACGQIPGNPYALHTLHQSTLTRVFDRAGIVAVVFGAGRYALVADRHGEESKRLYLVDLEQAREQVLELPAGTPLMLYELVNAGDVALAIFWHGGTMAEKLAYRVEAGGRLQPLQYVEAGKESGGTVAAGGQVSALLSTGRLDNLTRVEKEICKWDAAGGVYRVAGLGAVPYFYSEGYLVYGNVPDIAAVLEQRTTATVVDSCLLRAGLQSPPFRIQAERLRSRESNQSDLDGRILRADLYREEGFFWRYEFDLTAEYYYWTGIVGKRLYFVGNYVKYLDLAPLLTPAPVP